VILSGYIHETKIFPPSPFIFKTCYTKRENFEITELKLVTCLDRNKQNISKYFRPIKLILTGEKILGYNTKKRNSLHLELVRPNT
jgi:hypothetical protein